MEARRSFTSLFPISQSQIILPRPQHALRKQEQMRQKEVQLQNQLQCICQRQRDAHRRNQDLLRDFKRIEQELCLLTAKSDSFRRKQERFKKKMCPCISEQSKYAPANSDMSTMGQNFIKRFNDFPEANYAKLCEPHHFSASVGNIKPLTHFSLCPHQQQGPRECCIHSLCCGLVYPHFDGQFESFTPDACKISDPILDGQSEKKICSTADSSIPKNIMFIPNSKKDISQPCPGFVCDKDSSLNCQAMPTHIHGDLLQCILNSDMYNDWKEKLLKEVQKQMVGEHAVETTVEQSKEEDSSKRQACHDSSPNSFSEYPQKHLDALSKSHDHSVSPPAKDSPKSASKRMKTKQPKAIYQSSPCRDTAEQNIDDAFSKEKEISRVDSPKIELSWKLSSALDNLEGIEVKEQTSKFKENSDICKHQSEQEIKIIDSSEAESICEEGIDHPDPKYLCTGRFLDTFLKKSLEEFVDSSEEENAPPQGSQMSHIIQENENLSGCRISEAESSQEEASVSLGLSLNKNGSSESRNSAKGKRLGMEEQGLFGEMDQHNQSLCVGNNFVVSEGTKKGKQNINMAEQESESSDESESEMQEIKCDDANIGMLKEGSRPSGQSLSENNRTGNINGTIGESEIFREMLTEEIEKSSSEEDEESEEKPETESSAHERVCMFTLTEKDTQIKVNVNEESANEDTEEDTGEDELSVNDSQGSPIVIMDALIHGITKEEQSNIESDKEDKLTTKRGTQEECNTGNSIIDEDEMSDKEDISDEEKLSSEDLDVSDEINPSEEEENTDFWGSRHEENDSDINNMENDVQLQSSGTAGPSKQGSVDVSAREEDPQEPVPDAAAASCQYLIEDEELNAEKQRSSWLCCLKTCSLPHILSKSSEHQLHGKRYSEDGSMDILQMHPVEFGSSLPAEETPAGSIANVHTDAASAADGSDEESLHCETESEAHHQPWSDSEDNVHSFYD